MPANVWNPAQYEIFKRERALPFRDLARLVKRCEHGRIVDLGCGPGRTTVELVELLGGREVVGLDHSETMLAQAAEFQSARVRFEHADVATIDDRDAWDVVFSNAALHWIEDHDDLFARLARALRPRGQLAVQMPANFDHPASAIATSLAAQMPFSDALGGKQRGGHIDAPERYALRLHGAGFGEIDVHVRVYLHELAGPESVFEWVRGSTLTWYQSRLDEPLFAAFVARYRERLLATLPRWRPFPFTFKRLFVYGRKP